jgi:hypothetical protein
MAFRDVDDILIRLFDAGRWGLVVSLETHQKTIPVTQRRLVAAVQAL